jgi:hypothetical protein
MQLVVFSRRFHGTHRVSFNWVKNWLPPEWFLNNELLSAIMNQEYHVCVFENQYMVCTLTHSSMP